MRRSEPVGDVVVAAADGRSVQRTIDVVCDTVAVIAERIGTICDAVGVVECVAYSETSLPKH